MDSFTLLTESKKFRQLMKSAKLPGAILSQLNASLDDVDTHLDVMSKEENTHGFNLLTAQQINIMQLVCIGATNESIASTLCIDSGTVRNHLSTIYRKLGVKSRAEAVSLYNLHNR